MADQTIITKTSSKGAAIEIRLREVLPGQALPQAYVDGRYVGAGCVTRLAKPQGDVTHYIPSKPAVGLTSAEAQTITDAVDAIYRAYKESAEGQSDRAAEIAKAKRQGAEDDRRAERRATEHAWESGNRQ
jgi:hypothetical protein